MLNATIGTKRTNVVQAGMNRLGVERSTVTQGMYTYANDVFGWIFPDVLVMFCCFVSCLSFVSFVVEVEVERTSKS